MESHILLGWWNCFFAEKVPENLTSLWGQHLAHAAPSQARAPLPPLRCAGVAGGVVGAFASGPPPRAGRLMGGTCRVKSLENYIAANALWKCERIVEAPFFLKLSCSTSGGVLSLKMNGTHLHEGFENDIPLQMGEIWNISFQPFIFWGCALPETSTCKLDGWEDEKYVRFWGLNAYFQGRNCC